MKQSPSDSYSRLSGSVRPFDLGVPAPSRKPASPKAGEADASRPRIPVPGQRGRLSPAQIQVLVRHARRAYDRQREACLTDATFDDWRHDEVRAAVGADGLRSARNGQFRAILAHFLSLAGDDTASLSASMRTGPRGLHGATPGETVEDQEQAVWLVRDLLKRHGVHENYALAICRDQFHVGRLEALNAPQAMALLATLGHRLRRRK